LAPRVISYGCSFTQYMWPTYADILQAENKGWSGCGNERIFYFILEQYKKDKFENFDLITVQWSSPLRFDYLTRDGWTKADGPIRLSTENKNIWRRIKHHYNEFYEEEKTENYKIAIQALLQSTGKNYFITSMDDMRILYKGGYKFTTGMSWTQKPIKDDHPTIPQHIEYAKKIAKDFQFDLDDQIVKKCIQIHDQIMTSKSFELYTL